MRRYALTLTLLFLVAAPASAEWVRSFGIQYGFVRTSLSPTADSYDFMYDTPSSEWNRSWGVSFEGFSFWNLSLLATAQYQPGRPEWFLLDPINGPGRWDNGSNTYESLALAAKYRWETGWLTPYATAGLFRDKPSGNRGMIPENSYPVDVSRGVVLGAGVEVPIIRTLLATVEATYRIPTEGFYDDRGAEHRMFAIQLGLAVLARPVR